LIGEAFGLRRFLILILILILSQKNKNIMTQCKKNDKMLGYNMTHSIEL